MRMEGNGADTEAQRSWAAAVLLDLKSWCLLLGAGINLSSVVRVGVRVWVGGRGQSSGVAD